ncbi:hypothetical protein BDV97DRAFT_130013 [Delphinella strobiligena]|nr:hypothetical protein BDV97DRAFT_130013 [Delphinella strobiligena]
MTTLAVLLTRELLDPSSHLVYRAPRWLHSQASPDNGYLSKLLKAIPAALCGAVSLLFFMQSLLHLPSLPTLVMLPMIATFSRLLLMRVFDNVKFQSILPWANSRLCCLGLTCGIVLYDEYRLTVNGLLFAIPAMVLSGLSEHMFYSAYKPVEMSRKFPDICKTHIVLLTVFGILITIAWGSLFEDWVSRTSLRGWIPILCLNLTSTMVSILLEGTLFHNIRHRGQPLSVPSPSQDYTGTNVLYAGLTSYGAFLSHIPSYSSPWQLMAYLSTCLLLYDSRVWNTTFWQWKQLKSHVGPKNVRLEEVPRGGDMSRSPPVQTNDWSTIATVRYGTLAGLASAVIVWTLFILSNFDKHSSPRSVPQLDSNYTPPKQLEIVVSMYNESPEAVRQLLSELRKIPLVYSSQPSLVLYTKDDTVNITTLGIETGADHVEKLGNKGREGETYLHHILSRWDDLAKHTMFLQADIHNHYEFYPRVRDYFVEETGMLSLGFSGNTCNCNECGDRWGWNDLSTIIPDVYSRVYHERCDSKRILLSYKGQFIVSAARIRGVDRQVYEDLHKALINGESWAHQEPYLAGRPDSLDAPFFGYTLERLWSTLLQCSDLDIAFKCPTLLSGKRRWGTAEDCQCFD